MNIFGLTIGRQRPDELVGGETKATQLTSVEPAGMWTTLWSDAWETVTGGWQHNLRPRNNKTILAFSGVYACLSLISGDVSKMRARLMQRQGNGTWQEVNAEDTHGNAMAAGFLAVLKKPNAYQTRVQFLMNWICAKLIHGNAYILKERDRLGAVVALYVLDSCTVLPLVNDAGEVFYQIQGDYLAKLDEAIIVPASEIIHDRTVTFWHPLVGVSPIFACGHAAMQGLAIQANSEKFFENMSVPSGVLSAPGKIADETAIRIKENWQKGFGGKGIGGIAVIGDGLVYHQMTIPASDAQLIEQLGWTIADVARCFHVPPYKLGLQTNVTFSNASQLDQDYYSQCLQTLIEACEILLDEGLEYPPQYRTEFDLDDLIRMDPVLQAEANGAAIKAGYLAPNEARRNRNLAPATGGDTPYMQNQNWPLDQLAKRDVNAAPPAPPAPALPAPDAGPPPDPEEQARAIAATVLASVMPALEDKRAKAEAAEDDMAGFARRMVELAAAA